MRLPTAAIVAVLALAACTSVDQSTTPAAPSADPTGAVAALLQDLSGALGTGDPGVLARLADPAEPLSATELADLAANVRSLGLSTVSLRLAADGLDVVQGRSAVSVDVSWRQEDQPGLLSARVLVIVSVGQGQAHFVSARVPGEQGAPLWLLGRVDVARSPGVVVESLDPASVDRLRDLALRAVADVRTYLPPMPGDLVIQVPGSSGEFHAMLAGSEAGQASLAAVTFEPFGATYPWIVVDPESMSQLSTIAQQVVITHETVHVALDSPRSAAPLWLQEGFADFVAFAAHPAPVRRVASDLIQEMTLAGVPRHLPGRQEFEGSTRTEGAAYEASWLACRWIADSYGTERLLELYRVADQAGGHSRPIRRVLGISRAELTRQWRTELARLAA